MSKRTNEYLFEVKGGFDIAKENKPYLANDGGIIGFTTPNGATVRLAVCLEVESPDGKTMRYVTSEKEMAELGFEGLDYSSLDFHK